MTGKIALLLVALVAVSVSGKPSKPGKIVGGEDAAAHEFPWLVQILRNGVHYCGGAIYNEEWVITAAHCATASPGTYTIVAGEHDLSADEGTEQTRSVVRIVRHPQYEATVDFENDVAVMQVLPAFNFNVAVHNGTVAPSGFTHGVNGVVAGWGLLSEQGASPTILQRVAVPFVSDESCRASYGANAITETMVCAGVAGRDSCSGDSGGPLMCAGEEDDVLCGVVSWGRGCARPDYPGVYSELSYFSDWFPEAILPEPEDNSSYVEKLEGCGGALVGSNGRIGYQLNPDETYGDNERCVWSIRARTRDSIRLNLEADDFADVGDYLEVTEVNVDAATGGRVFRMDRANPVLLVTGPLILVTFVSNGEGNGAGFSFLFQGLGDLGPAGNFFHHHVGGASGSFSYPPNGGQYTNSELSTVVVNSAGGPMTVTVTRMSLEASTGCVYDVVNIHNHGANGYTNVASVCGTTIPAPFVTDGAALFVLSTDSSITNTGYSFSWQTN